MQGRARGRKGERKTHHITSYHHITMEFGGYLLNVGKNPTRARARKGEAQGVLSYQKVTGIFHNPHICQKLNSDVQGSTAMNFCLFSWRFFTVRLLPGKSTYQPTCGENTSFFQPP